MTWLKAHAGELLTGLAWLAGWFFLTSAAASAVNGKWVAAIVAASFGLLMVSLGGWRLLFVILRDGLYVLTRGEK